MDGALIVDKPEGWTSHDVVARSRRLLGERRVGHTGTLDPFATGVLVLLVGRATRLAQFLAGAVKEYEALIRLGYATDTGDLTGVRRDGADPAANFDPAAVEPARVEAALASLRGEIEQTPPMYSAKKVKGRKLYELARRGEEVERAAVRVRVHEFELSRGRGGELFTPNADGTFDVAARVVCSAGTYVRSLAESFGAALGVGAHLAALRRTRAGAFSIEDAVRLDELERRLGQHGPPAAAEPPAPPPLLPPDAALSGLAALHLTGREAERVRHGAAVPAPGEGFADGELVRLRDEAGALLAVGIYDEARGAVQPRVTLA